MTDCLKASCRHESHDNTQDDTDAELDALRLLLGDYHRVLREWVYLTDVPTSNVAQRLPYVLQAARELLGRRG